MRVVSTKEHGKRNTALGQEPGKRKRGFDFKPPKTEPSDGAKEVEALLAYLRRLRQQNPTPKLIKAQKKSVSATASKREPTKYELSVLKFLFDYALAEKRGQILPAIPIEVRKK